MEPNLPVHASFSGTMSFLTQLLLKSQLFNKDSPPLEPCFKRKILQLQVCTECQGSFLLEYQE